MLYPLLTLVLSGFSIVVASSWFHSHIATGDHWLWITFPLLVYSAIASGAVFLLSRSKTPFHISPLFALVLLLLALFIVFDAQIFLRPMFLTGTPLLNGQEVIAANLTFGKMVFSILILFILLTITFVSTGNLILRLTHLSRHVSTAESAHWQIQTPSKVFEATTLLAKSAVGVAE